MTKEDLKKRCKLKDMPEPPKYFDSHSDIFFVPGVERQVNVQHILKDNQTKMRIRKFLPDSSEDQLQQEIEVALKFAESRIAHDFSVVVPHFFPAKQLMQLLVPIRLPSVPDSSRFHLAAVYSPVKSNEGKIIYYNCPTLLTLGMAFTNARLVKKINHHWLRLEDLDSLSQDEEGEDVYFNYEDPEEQYIHQHEHEL